MSAIRRVRQVVELTKAPKLTSSRIPLYAWTPRSQLVTPVTETTRARYPAIDCHNHLGRWLSSDWMVRDVPDILRILDEANVERLVNLDGLWGDELSANLDRYDRAFPGRFTTYCQIDWQQMTTPDGAARLMTQLEDSHRRGAKGVKIWKNLGLQFKDARGRRLRTDDDSVVALLRRAGELGLPVLIHTADPTAFFEPLNGDNERIEELTRYPEAWVGDRARFPTFATLMEEFDALLAQASGTQFIGAHVGCQAEDLTQVSDRLDAHPNLVVDIAGRISELGRQPRAFARFVSRYPDRILFGTDNYPVDSDTLGRYFRFLETDDEDFAYSCNDPPPLGRWNISAAALPDEHLRAIYRDNAIRLGL